MFDVEYGLLDKLCT